MAPNENPNERTTMFINWIRSYFTPLEWTIFTLMVFVMLVATISFADAVLVCGSEGFGPSAANNC